MTQHAPQKVDPNTPNYFRPNPPEPRHVIIARRAGGLMIGLGVVVALMGGCVLLGSAVPIGELPPDKQEMVQQFELQSHISFHTLFLAAAAVLAAIALFEIITGLFVWRSGSRGRKASLVVAIVMTSLLATIWVLQLLAAIATGNAANVAAGAGLFLISLCLMAWQLAWLIQALHATRSAPKSAAFYPFSPQGNLAPSLHQPMGLPAQLMYPPPPPEPGPTGWPYSPPPPPPPPASPTPASPTPDVA